MDDDDEDFEALFFTECEELLADLQEHLELLHSGDGDQETLNAAFRAVHSVKGGAAAFGFDHLISFAHKFESVMDLARSDELELTPVVCQILLRSGDVMESLIEKARDRDDNPSSTMEKVLGELASLIEGDGASTQSSLTGSEKEETDDLNTDKCSGGEIEHRSVEVIFCPDPGFFQSGHDMLKLVTAAKSVGLTKIEIVGEVSPLPEFRLDDLALSWIMRFEIDQDQKVLEEFFLVYEAAAKWRIKYITSESENNKISENAALPVANTTVNEPKNLKKKPVSEQTKAKGVATGSKGKKPGASKSLRVELARIDRLVNLVGEIVITQAALAQKLGQESSNVGLEVEHSVEAMSRQTRDLQESVMAIRAQPVKSVFSRMPRVVRDLADTLGKDVRLELSGEHTEVDTTVIEELAEPLTHMLRNSMDHGLETPEERENSGKPRTGVIKLAAEHRGERVILTISDDGRGINRDVVLQKAIERGLVSEDESLSPDDIDQLIFHAGFSTAEQVSSVSGRGVGMDVVKRKIQELGGRCWLKSRPGQGCTFTIALPLTLAVLEGMTIGVGNERYILPLSNVVEALRLESAELHEMPDSSKVLTRRGAYLPVLSIRKALQASENNRPEKLAIIVDTESDGLVALLIDELIGQRQVVLKSLEANYHRVEGVSGATILGDGRVALILDIPNLVHLQPPSAIQSEEMFH